MTKIMTSRDFNQDISRAKRMADDGPVVITDRGVPAYVLMKHDAFERLGKGKPSILDLLGDPNGGDIVFEPERTRGPIGRPVKF